MLPDTDLTVTVTDAAGNTSTLDSHASDPAYRPRNITCGSQQGSGFYVASFNVSLEIDREHPALHLRDKVQIIGANGDTAYEGYVTDLPRSTDSDGRGTLSVQLAGYMADTARASFRMPFVDRDLSNWGPAATQRRVNLLSTGYGQVADPGTSPDQSGRPTLRTAFNGAWAASSKPISEAWYDAGPNTAIGRITATWTRNPTVLTADANWTYVASLSTDDLAVSFDTTVNLHAAGPGVVDLTATTATRRFAVVDLLYTSAAAAGGDGVEYGIDWSDVAVYGNHGLPLLGTAPFGVAASDVIRYLIATYCPKLNADGVQDTTYPIGHLAFRERTKVYDALLKVNSYHLWQIAVWEGGTVHFGPVDMDEWDWEIRHDEVGSQIGLQGDSIEQLRNGIIVSFTNVATGATEELHPDDYAELRDDSIDNPWSLHGDLAYGDPYTIPFPCTAANALELGRLQMLEDNQVRAPGSFTVGPWIRDRSGILQPAWKVRSGDRIRLTSSANLSDRPRLIQECSYAHDGRTATIAVDSTIRLLEGFVDRTLTALAAAGLAA